MIEAPRSHDPKTPLERGVRLILVGLRHRDPRHGRRLEEILFRARPERVVLEMSPASLAYRRGPGRAHAAEVKALLGSTDPASPRATEARELLSVLALPVECRAALRYARETLGNARVRLADRSEEAIPLLEEVDAWALEVAARLREGRDPIPFTPLPDALRAPSLEERGAVEARERRLARAVRRACEGVEEARVVYAGGIDHLAPLAALLADLRPTVRALEAPREATR